MKTKKKKQNETKRNKTVCRFDKLVKYIYIYIHHTHIIRT